MMDKDNDLVSELFSGDRAADWLDPLPTGESRAFCLLGWAYIN